MNILRGPQSSVGAGPPPETGRRRSMQKPVAAESTHTRASRGLEQFFTGFRDQTGLTILDLGGVHQENVNFITSLGHKFYAQDFLRIYQTTFGAEPADQANPGRIEYFLRESLDYPDEHFDGVLAWDVLEYLAPPLLAATVERLLRMLKPEGYMLTFFHSAERLEMVPAYAFRIQDPRTLEVSESGGRAPEQLFNNRSLEKLFQKFESVKFFLTRERLREVIVRK
jgi:hypothetical protein